MKFLVATSGSGGHIFPALMVGEELRTRGHNVEFAGDVRGFARQLEERDFNLHPLDARGFSSRTPRGVLVFGYKMAASLLASLCILRRCRPDAVLGFGGYGAFPVVSAAVLARVPTLIHEQNVAPGRANRFLSRCVSRVTISFPETQERLGAAAILTGCPSHRPRGPYDRAALRAGWGLDPAAFTLLILGGSQGSRCVNAVALDAVPLLAAQRPVQVIHITGEHDFDQVKDAYAFRSVRAVVFPFLDAMDQAYAAADIVVGRAGAVCVTEFALFHLPAVLIPYPHAGGHQRENANALKRTAPVEVIEDNDATPERLAAAVQRLCGCALTPADAAGAVIPDAAGKVAAEAEKLAQHSPRPRGEGIRGGSSVIDKPDNVFACPGQSTGRITQHNAAHMK